MKNQNLKTMLNYHEATKHHPGRFARSSGFLDWANEPVPFRRYDDIVLTTKLPFMNKKPDVGHLGMYEKSRNPVYDLTIESLSSFLELSLALSAWKQYGKSKWALRVNPSSGNLHAEETHLILPPLQGLPSEDGGVYHYNPYVHGLQMRAEGFWRRVFDDDGSACFYLVLSSVVWRESWKYGERAFRYLSLDIGHALCAISISANLHGWNAKVVNTISDDNIEELVGFNKTNWPEHEKEYPEVLLEVGKNRNEKGPKLNIAVDAIKEISFAGTPNVLSKSHVDWSIINDAARASKKLDIDELNIKDFSKRAIVERDGTNESAVKIIKNRRSAQSYDGKTGVSKENLLYMLEKTLQSSFYAPFDICAFNTNVHLFLFLHNVHGLPQGLYLFIRKGSIVEKLKGQLKGNFLWKNEGTMEIPLYLLETGDFRQKTYEVCCHQEIAAMGAFCVSMVAAYKEPILQTPHMYKRLHWEAGMIGQVLYLEAQARGLSGTGIGCFFDDVAHGLFGLKDDTYQVLYHFTVGGAVHDRRLILEGV